MPGSPSSADRNLLFGVLALQADLVTRDQLVAGITAWANEKATPLGELLVRQGALSAEGRALLEPLVAHHLARHGGDPQRSLAAVSSVSPSARAALAGVADRDVQASVLRLPGETPSPAPADAHATVGVSVLPKQAAGLRYRVLRPHARGGLGEVFVARDEETSREVALKEILPAAAADPDARARFLLEAEVTANLEHPGVVPVYGLGAYPDGRPFYAMRFVRGDSLKEAIEKYHAPAGKARPASERNLAFRELLRRFVDVCETLAYAHVRGVLHRDLKPGNVMVGRFGETLVVDWGLAKVTGRPDPAASAAPGDGSAAATGPDVSAIRLGSAGAGSSATRTGRAVGTPAYMSPEQAAGRLDALGPASDVYGLGATLYHLLTGRPPVEGGDLGAVLRRVERGEIPPPRAVDPAVPKALEAVCRKAMSLRPEDRYGSAKLLAEEVEHWLADEPVAALPETPGRRAGRWARRHRTETAAAAAALLVVLLSAGGSGWWYQSVRADRAAEATLRATEERLRRQAARDDIARAIAEADELREAKSWNAARTVLTTAERRLPDAAAPGLAERLRVAGLDLRTAEALDEIRLRQATWTNEGFDRRFAIGRDGAFSRAVGGYLRETGGRELDLWDGDPAAVADCLARSEIVPAFIEAFDDWSRIEPAKEGARLLEVVSRMDPDPLRSQVRGIRVRQRDPDASIGQSGLEALVQNLDFADTPPTTLNQLAVLLSDAGRSEDAVALWRRATQEHPDDFWLHMDYGDLLDDQQGSEEEAIGHFRAALAIRPVAAAYNNLGNMLRSLGRLTEAEAAFRKALELDPRLAFAHVGLANVFMEQQKLLLAEAEYKAAAELDPDLALPHVGLSWAYAEMGKLVDAEAEARKAIELDSTDFFAHMNLGNALRELGRAEEAATAFQRAIELDPGHAGAQNNLGHVLSLLGRAEEAATAFQRAIELDPTLLVAQINLGLALRGLGRAEEAVLTFRRAIEIDPDSFYAHLNLGITHSSLGRSQDAESALRRAVELAPGEGGAAFYELGIELDNLGRLAEAEAAYRKAIVLGYDEADVHNNLGNALRTLGRAAEAEAEFRMALDRDPKLAYSRMGLGILHHDAGRFADAEKEFREALALDPDDALIHSNLGNALRDLGRFAEAEAAYRRALELDPGLSTAQSNMAILVLTESAAVAAEGRSAEAEERLLGISPGKAAPARPPLEAERPPGGNPTSGDAPEVPAPRSDP